MALLLNPGAFQHPALAGQLTPPPSPGNKAAEPVQHKANTGKLRRSKTPDALQLIGSNHEGLLKDLTKTNPQTVEKDSAYFSPNQDASNVSRPISSAGISPLSTDFEIKDAVAVSRPDSYIPAEFRSKDIPKSPLSPDNATQKPARQLPISAYSSKSPSRANTVKDTNSSRPQLPPLSTEAPSPGIKRSSSAKHNLTLQKDLPPPPPKDPSPQRTIAPLMNPDDLPMPENPTKNNGRVIRTVQSIGMLHAGPKTGDSSRTEFRPSTVRPTRPFHKRFFTSFFSGSTKGTPSIHSNETSTPSFTRRMSHLARRKEQIPEDPLAPVSTLPVMTNHEDVIGGLTYLPRYTNNFAGFCKSAWRLQLSDPKSFDIRNRNSTRETPTLKCSKCTFEGPLHPQRVLGDRYVWARIPDSKVYSSFGVTYTWQFLFKSHIAQKKGAKTPKTPSQVETNHALIPPLPGNAPAEVDMAEGLFGCIFCCVQGLGTPVFKGPEALSWHIRSHVNDRVRDLELQHRFKIIIGREPAFNEKFDVHIPHLDDRSNLAVSMSVTVGGDGQWEEPSKMNKIDEISVDPGLKQPTELSTPMLNLDIHNEKSWEVKTEGGMDRVHNDAGEETRMWVKQSMPFFKRVQ